MSVGYIALNGNIFNPTSVEIEDMELADTRRMLNGYLHKYHVAWKNKWTIAWELIPESVKSAIRTLYRTTGSLTFVDYTGSVYYVHTVSFKETLEAENIRKDGMQFYSVELVVEEL